MIALPPVAPFQSVADVVTGLTTLDGVLRERRDRRGVFVAAYLAIARELQQRLAAGAFEDPGWASHYIVAFADLYRRALLGWSGGDSAGVPKGWQIAFAAGAGGATLILQDFLLGCSAHLNHDLAIALDEVSLDPDRASRYRDHRAVVDAVRAAADALAGPLARCYAPGLALVDGTPSPLDEGLTGFSFAKARDAAWEGGVALANAQSEQERTMARTRIDDQAALLARLLVLLPAAPPWLSPVLGRLEAAAAPWPPR